MAHDKECCAFGLLAAGGILVLAGDFTEKMIGIFLPILALFLQERWALHDLAVALDKNFEILEGRMRDHLNARLSKVD